MDRDAYLAHHMNAWRDNWQRMFMIPGEGLTTAYADFLRQPGELSITTYSGLSMMDVKRSSSPDALIEHLNPQISVNQGTPRPLRLAFSMSQWRDRAVSNRSGSSPSGDAGQSPDESTPEPASQQPLNIALDQLERHLNSPVTLTLSDGRSFEGEIIEVSEFKPRRLQFRRSVHNGTMTMPVEVADIDSVTQR